jgi:hypothetical protein
MRLCSRWVDAQCHEALGVDGVAPLAYDWATMVRRAAALLVLGALAACSSADNPPPKVTAVAPNVVARASATPADVEGEGFYGSGRVDLGSDTPIEVDGEWVVAVDGEPLAASDTVLVDARTIHVVIPSGLLIGRHAVTVTCPSGLADTLENAFSVVGCVANCGDKVCCPDAGETSVTCPEDCRQRCGDGTCGGTENALTCPGDCQDDCGDGVCTGTENAGNCASDCPAVCGDTVCTATESAATCPQDCKAMCGDGLCTDTENAATCASDCPDRCGDGVCTGTENARTCPKDCAQRCGDGVCTGTENARTCPSDCPEKCGDGFCTGTENALRCPSDCPEKCGDGFCTGTENAQNCAGDCPASCGDGFCTGAENALGCPSDCPEKCGDGFCTGAENAQNCAGDCPASCGDGYCTHTETAATCALDCPQQCGDGQCTGTETAATCPGDCPASCGDGYCTHTETSATCLADCPADITGATDAYTRQQFPTENHGGDPDIRAGSGSTVARANRAMLAFDVSGITCNVTSATMRLNYYAEDFAGVSIVLTAHRITSPWLAPETTWNRASDAAAWTSPGGDFDPAVVATAPLGAGAFGWVSWDVTSAVEAWLSGTPNYGLILMEPNDNQGGQGRKYFYSKDSLNVALRPTLVVSCAP